MHTPNHYALRTVNCHHCIKSDNHNHQEWNLFHWSFLGLGVKHVTYPITSFFCCNTDNSYIKILIVIVYKLGLKVSDTRKKTKPRRYHELQLLLHLFKIAFICLLYRVVNLGLYVVQFILEMIGNICWACVKAEACFGLKNSDPMY